MEKLIQPALFMSDSGRRSDLFRRMRRQRSSAMRSGIAVVALPCLGEKSLSRAIRARAFPSSQTMPSVSSLSRARVSAGCP
jgi:hypothetical protein